MPIWLLLGLAGVAAYAALGPVSQQQQAAGQTGIAPGFQGGPPAPSPTPIATTPPPSGGQVYDPNLGGNPYGLLSGLSPGYQGQAANPYGG